MYMYMFILHVHTCSDTLLLWQLFEYYSGCSDLILTEEEALKEEVIAIHGVLEEYLAFDNR